MIAHVLRSDQLLRQVNEAAEAHLRRQRRGPMGEEAAAAAAAALRELGPSTPCPLCDRQAYNGHQHFCRQCSCTAGGAAGALVIPLALPLVRDKRIRLVVKLEALEAAWVSWVP